MLVSRQGQLGGVVVRDTRHVVGKTRHVSLSRDHKLSKNIWRVTQPLVCDECELMQSTQKPLQIRNILGLIKYHSSLR